MVNKLFSFTCFQIFLQEKDCVKILHLTSNVSNSGEERRTECPDTRCLLPTSAMFWWHHVINSKAYKHHKTNIDVAGSNYIYKIINLFNADTLKFVNSIERNIHKYFWIFVVIVPPLLGFEILLPKKHIRQTRWYCFTLFI